MEDIGGSQEEDVLFAMEAVLDRSEERAYFVEHVSADRRHQLLDATAVGLLLHVFGHDLRGIGHVLWSQTRSVRRRCHGLVHHLIDRHRPRSHCKAVIL